MKPTFCFLQAAQAFTFLVMPGSSCASFTWEVLPVPALFLDNLASSRRSVASLGLPSAEWLPPGEALYLKTLIAREGEGLLDSWGSNGNGPPVGEWELASVEVLFGMLAWLWRLPVRYQFDAERTQLMQLSHLSVLVAQVFEGVSLPG